LTNRRVRILAVVVSALAVSLVGVSDLTAALRSKHVVAARYNGQLERKVLTTTKGLTLYFLHSEHDGRFLCKGTCLSVWHPVMIGAGTKPTGPVKLGTVRRRDNGKTQVTYRGLPLYTFSADERPGEISGNGITDVDTWHVATPPRSG
jgi:predicted lipoprotein with Yx(FWY)xxD motif